MDAGDSVAAITMLIMVMFSAGVLMLFAPLVQERSPPSDGLTRGN